MDDEGIIHLGSEFAKQIEFDPDKFEGYLWRKNKTIWISLIISRHEGQGNLIRLFNNILREGYEIMIPCPSARMKQIATLYGFKEVPEGELKDCSTAMIYQLGDSFEFKLSEFNKALEQW